MSSRHEDLWKSFGTRRSARRHVRRRRTARRSWFSARRVAGRACSSSTSSRSCKPDRGSIVRGQRDLRTCDPHELNEARKSFGMVFQGAALFDSMTVGENVGLPAQGALGHPRAPNSRTSWRRSSRWSASLGSHKLAVGDLGRHEEARGARAGHRARPGRHPVRRADDRARSRSWPSRSTNSSGTLQRKVNATSIVVTHDLHSASFTGDSVALMHEGRIEFVGTIEELTCSDNGGGANVHREGAEAQARGRRRRMSHRPGGLQLSLDVDARADESIFRGNTMTEHGNEVRVGVMLTVAGVLLVVGILWLGGFTFGDNRYTFNIMFEDVAGLVAGDKVTVAGLNAGEILSLSLAPSGRSWRTWRWTTPQDPDRLAGLRRELRPHRGQGHLGPAGCERRLHHAGLGRSGPVREGHGRCRARDGRGAGRDPRSCMKSADEILNDEEGKEQVKDALANAKAASSDLNAPLADLKAWPPNSETFVEMKK